MKNNKLFERYRPEVKRLLSSAFGVKRRISRNKLHLLTKQEVQTNVNTSEIDFLRNCDFVDTQKVLNAGI